MSKYNEKIINFAWKCYKRLLLLPYNSEVCTAEIAHLIINDTVCEDFPDLMDVHYALREIIKSEGAYIMDNTKYYFNCVGTPENIPYFFRPKYPLGWAIFQNLLIQVESNYNDEGTQYAKEIINATDWDYKGYDQPIPLKEAYKWLEKAYKKGCSLKIVADPEYLEGGIYEGQCDGWKYHFELDIN